MLFGIVNPNLCLVMSNIIVIIFSILPGVYLFTSNSLCDLGITVTSQIESTGFHRLLEISVIINTSLSSKLSDKCYTAVHQVLPSGVFVDPEQLNELSNFRKTPVNLYHVREPVDVEASENFSSSLNAYIIHNNEDSKTDSSVMNYKLTLPIHVRYHSPQHGGQWRDIAIPSSSLLLRCEGQDSLPHKENNFLTDVLGSSCVERLGYNLPCTVNKLDNSEETALCDDWYKVIHYIPRSSQQNGNDLGLILTVPVGDIDHLLLVQIITLIITNLSAVYIILHLFSSKMH